MNEGDGMTYSGSGVDIDAESSAVASLIGSLANSTREKGTLGAPVKLEGGFGGLKPTQTKYCTYGCLTRAKFRTAEKSLRVPRASALRALEP